MCLMQVSSKSSLSGVHKIVPSPISGAQTFLSLPRIVPAKVQPSKAFSQDYRYPKVSLKTRQKHYSNRSTH